MARQLTYAERLELISKWKNPPGPSERLRLERAEHMVRRAISLHEPFRGLDITVAPKGSYPNKTNVRGDSDVDIMVRLNAPFHSDGLAGWWFGPPQPPGPWTKDKLREEVHSALTNQLGWVDANHNLAFYVPEVRGSPPSIDVVPCFKWVVYDFSVPGGRLEGSVVYGRHDGKRVINWPELQLANGRAKNDKTNLRYKFVVRVLKSVENDLAEAGVVEALPSYFSECLIYNVPNHVFLAGDFDDAVRASLQEVYRQLTETWFGSLRMLEPNGIKKVFGERQKWTEKHARELIKGALNYLNYGV
ncbi:hypothetical protein GT352_05045 [Streptomyces sp. SID1046]|uniref:hypothetical protein n=1 Tax=Streptomyces sp. SID1046 TaxID=2690249 RepID=UPI001369E278|nr:hypothetical protein [Streptomyces sp. SID1046]MYV73310.1 hypothetical protein [Streptomyces sp. SID1046]